MSRWKQSLPVCKRLAAFLSDRRGSISVMTAVTMVPFMVAAGTAVDMGRANRTIGQMQKAVDTAALAAAATYRPVKIAGEAPLTGDEAKLHVAEQMVEANLPEAIKLAAGAPQVTIAGNVVEVSLEAEMATSFMKLVGIDTMDLGVTASAQAEIDANGCIVALGKNGNGIEVGGNVDLEVKGCWLYSNKQADKSIDIIGTAKVKVPGSCSVGSTSVSNQATVHDLRLVGCHLLDDPLAGWTHPDAPLNCDHDKYKQNASKEKSIVLYPGVYCGGLQLSGYDHVELKPGIYHIDGGPLTINSKVELIGNGVGFYLSQDATSVTINGSAEISLSAPSTGAMAGKLIAMEPGAGSLISAKINGGADLDLAGTIYLPTATLDISGNSTTHSVASQIIAHSVKLSGVSKLSFQAQLDEFGNPVGEAFVRMVRLIK